MHKYSKKKGKCVTEYLSQAETMSEASFNGFMAYVNFFNNMILRMV